MGAMDTPSYQPVVKVSFWGKSPKSRLETNDLACVFWANRPKLCYCHEFLDYFPAQNSIFDESRLRRATAKTTKSPAGPPPSMEVVDY
jgi:hypothetical protein